jgi:LPS export ABC transporter protein LptC
MDTGRLIVRGRAKCFAFPALLLSMVACTGGGEREVVDVVFDPESSYTLRTTDMSSLISDSGVTRFRLQAPEVLMFDKAADPYLYCPRGIYIERFDTLFRVEASIRADTAYQWDKKGLAKLIGNVRITNLQGERFETDLLYWDRDGKRFYSDDFIRIERADRILTGRGFESNDQMTDYRIFQPQGTFTVDVEEP